MTPKSQQVNACPAAVWQDSQNCRLKSSKIVWGGFNRQSAIGNDKAALNPEGQGLLLGMSNYRLVLPLEGVFEGSELPQHTGVLLMRRQQVQPQSTMQETQSQQACSISQQRWSPLVQVTQTPESDISYLHMPMVRL